MPFSPGQQRTRALDKHNQATHARTSVRVPGQGGLGGTKRDTHENGCLELTRTLANLSSSSPGSGMGSFRGMLCPLKSGCWSMLPAFPMAPL